MPPQCDTPKAVAQDATVTFTGDVDSGSLTIASATIDGGDVVVSACDADGDCAELRFTHDLAAPPSLPPVGAALRAGQANCFGEGCSDTQWRVDDAFEVRDERRLRGLSRSRRALRHERHGGALSQRRVSAPREQAPAPHA